MTESTANNRTETCKGDRANEESTQPGILVVEDEAIVRRFCCAALERGGHRTFAASNAMECLQFLETTTRPIAVVLVDIHMPGLSGLDIVGQIRRRTPSTAVVLMSGCGDPRVGPAVEAGLVDRFLTKPFSADDLCSVVESFLREGAGSGS